MKNIGKSLNDKLYLKIDRQFELVVSDQISSKICLNLRWQIDLDLERKIYTRLRRPLYLQLNILTLYTNTK